MSADRVDLACKAYEEATKYKSAKADLRAPMAAVIAALDAAAEPLKCNRPPEGWYCGLARDHDGPCPAWPVSHATAGPAAQATFANETELADWLESLQECDGGSVGNFKWDAAQRAAAAVRGVAAPPAAQRYPDDAVEAWMPTDEDMRGGFAAAKRIHVIAGSFDGWWIGHGKDESCQIEGTANHWFWLAYLLLGLVDEKDSPYSEDKPLPFSPQYIRTALKNLEPKP